MADINTVVIISDRQEFINQISQKLVLLRNLDKVKSCSVEEAQNLLESFSPNVIILHCDNNNTHCINLIKKLKKQEIFSAVPILLINENCSREIIIEAFDNEISDVLFMPVIDYELLIRVIWCLKKNELSLNIESQKNFLTQIGVVQEDTGVYTQRYCEDYIKNEMAQTKKYSQRACIILISQDKKYPNYKDPKDFITVVKNSIRLNDSIIIKDIDEYYIYLQKTKLNGAYSVFERINNNLGIDCGANAGVIEIQEQSYEEVKTALETALKKANENTNSLIVASDFYNQEEKTQVPYENPSKIMKKHEEKLSSMDDEIEYEEVDFLPPPPPPPPAPVRSAFDKNSIKLFNQAFTRKLKVVVAPVFKKYETILKIKRQDFNVNSYVGTKSLFNVSIDDTSASMSIEYDGIEHAIIKLLIIDNNQKRLSETETIDFTILDYRKVSLLLSELINKFIAVTKKR